MTSSKKEAARVNELVDTVCARLIKLGVPSRPAFEFSGEHLCIVSSEGVRYRVLDVLDQLISVVEHLGSDR
jgi:hypothetical protein